MKKYIFFFFVLIFLVLIFFVLNRWRQKKLVIDGVDLTPYTKEEWVEEIKSAFKDAKENKKELKKILTEVEPEYRKQALFLIAFMPYPDLIQANSSVILDNIRYANLAKKTYPWAKDLPDDIFLNYVLPYRNSQEPIENFRPYFFEKLYPVVKDLKDAYDASIAVNRWIAERVKYKPTQREDQGPFETLKGGYGRCEELVILYNGALRSIGIPSRKVWTPFWSIRDDNHAWTELYIEDQEIDGRWWYTGAAEPKDSLNSAWFDQVVKKASLVFSKPYGEPAAQEVIYYNKRGESYVNSTPFYTETNEFEIEVVSGKKRIKDIFVIFSVFNYGALRRIASVKTGKKGKATILIGKGTYFISVGDSKEYTWKVVTIGKDQKQKVLLDLKEKPEEKESFWLSY